MISIPIVFAIDHNVVMQCGVTITSLLKNAEKETFYDIYILYNRHNLIQENRDSLLRAFDDNTQCHISFIDVGESFSESEGLATGHITTATYFRLAIPTLFHQFEKVIYSDIDIIYQQDLAELFQSSLKNDELLAAALDLSIDRNVYFDSKMPATIGKDPSNYFNAGFLVMNLQQLRDTEILTLLAKHAKIKYVQNDQDVLNIVCGDRIQIIPSIYNFQPSQFANYMWGRDKVELQFRQIFQKATLHYTGPDKPWNSLACVASDAWWHYYRQSPFYDDSFYFKHQYDLIESSRNDFRKKKSKDLLVRILVNLKHRVTGK